MLYYMYIYSACITQQQGIISTQLAVRAVTCVLAGKILSSFHGLTGRPGHLLPVAMIILSACAFLFSSTCRVGSLEVAPHSHQLRDGPVCYAGKLPTVCGHEECC